MNDSEKGAPMEYTTFYRHDEIRDTFKSQRMDAFFDIILNQRTISQERPESMNKIDIKKYFPEDKDKFISKFGLKKLTNKVIDIDEAPSLT
jgi:hypothetical protein